MTTFRLSNEDGLYQNEIIADDMEGFLSNFNFYSKFIFYQKFKILIAMICLLEHLILTLPSVR